jgi:hypothetical protein
MEDGNIKEHRNYLQLEEEKRKRARVVRTAVEGPLLRWISRAEETTFVVQPPVPSPQPPVQTYYQPVPPIHPLGQPPTYYQPSPVPSTSQTPFGDYQYPPQVHPVPPPGPSSYVIPPPAPLVKTETVAKNYIVHESSQQEGANKPLWKDTMVAMFGDHVRWETMKVYTGKNRPLCECP